jgi:hypothetical protein
MCPGLLGKGDPLQQAGKTHSAMTEAWLALVLVSGSISEVGLGSAAVTDEPSSVYMSVGGATCLVRLAHQPPRDLVTAGAASLMLHLCCSQLIC